MVVCSTWTPPQLWSLGSFHRWHDDAARAGGVPSHHAYASLDRSVHPVERSLELKVGWRRAFLSGPLPSRFRSVAFLVVSDQLTPAISSFVVYPNLLFLTVDCDIERLRDTRRPGRASGLRRKGGLCSLISIPRKRKTAVFVNNAAVRDLIVGINLLSTGTVKLRAERDGALEGIEVELKNKEERFSCALGFSWTLDCERVLAGGVSR